MIINNKTKRKKLTVAISLALAIGTANADFAPKLELSALNGSIGFALNGVSTPDRSGSSVSTVGDINGDGFDDLIIGAPYATTAGGAFAGASYVVFGSDQGLPNPLELSVLNGSNGFVINGESTFDGSGFSVDAAGDINGDGIDDLIIGAPDASPGESYSGISYVVFGSDQVWNSLLNLSSLDGSNGFAINGVSQYDNAGASVSSAGDVNDDGIDDLIIGAPNASGSTGAGYVVFGNNQAWGSELNLSGLDGSNGFVINGVNEYDSLGISVSEAGDINGDGIDDLIIGAPYAGTPGAYVGVSYVVFGSDQAWASSLDLSSLDGSDGFAINGVGNGDSLGTAVSKAGDINVDGIDDLIIGAFLADPKGDDSGASYVVFGSDQAWSSPLNLSGLNGSNGFVINGVSAGDNSGISVSATGDINVDGFDDLIIGAPFADPNGGGSGASYVVFGKDLSWVSALNLSSLNGTNGFVVNGISAGDNSGASVSGAGDINGDNIADILIGAPFVDPNGDDSGASYVIFGVGADTDKIFADGFE
jgi:hypothetical protein